MILNYHKETWAFGRNGVMKQVGVCIDITDEYIVLSPVNTKGIGRGNLRIPLADAPSFLKYIQDNLPIPEPLVDDSLGDCAYCGRSFPRSQMFRDGGQDYCSECMHEMTH